MAHPSSSAGSDPVRIPREPRGGDLLQRLDVRKLPKTLLHEHLDGGLRPATIIELAQECGYDALPTQDAGELAEWFHRGAQRGSLPLYLEGFAHTCAVLQTEEALERAAYEFIEDMAADGVVYVECRFAPVLHLDKGLAQDRVVRSVIRGLARGEHDHGVKWGLIICGMRNRTDTLEAAELAIDFRDRGVVGFDLAGEEGGYPPKKHLDAFHAIQRANFNITIHAGEAFGVESIWQALQWCGAHRLGHATRLVDDMTIVDDRVVALGSLAQYVLDQRLPLEICLKSNVDTGAATSIGDHPFRHFWAEGFRVSLNTDDRLMSDTTMTNEYELATRAFGLSLYDLEKLAVNGMKSAFIPFQRRLEIIFGVIKPGYAQAAAALAEADAAA